MLYSNDYHWPFQAPSSPSAPDPPAIRTPFFWHNLHLSHFLCVLVLARQKTTDPGRSQVMLLAQPGVPVMGAGPLHSPPCCIPPPPVWVEQAQVLPKGATLTAPHFHSSSRPAQQPGVGGTFGGCPQSPSVVQPRGLSVPASLQIPPLSLCSGCSILPLPHSGPLWGPFERSGQQLDREDPPSCRFHLGREQTGQGS